MWILLVDVVMVAGQEIVMPREYLIEDVLADFHFSGETKRNPSVLVRTESGSLHHIKNCFGGRLEAERELQDRIDSIIDVCDLIYQAVLSRVNKYQSAKHKRVRPVAQKEKH